MAFLEPDDIKSLYEESKREAQQWQEDYPAYQRLMDNGLLEGLDPNLPEVNDGSLAAALFKLPKRIVSSKLTGTVKAIDRDEAWLSELANLQWQNEIIPNANTQAPFARKWKDAVRKAAGFGSVPLITIFVEKDGKRHADFVVAPNDTVFLESGKVSDYDSDVFFWEVYYSKLQLKNMIEQAKAENKEAKESNNEGYNKWNIKDLEEIYKSHAIEEKDPRPGETEEVIVRQKGYKFCVTFQRGVDAPFYMYHPATKKTVREWTNPDPTGDVPVHYLYCYQDFVNPYGIGIVKLAGGTQNVLDYMRQADVLATQIGIRPPVSLEGNTDDADLDSIVYAQDALWLPGSAKLTRQELANGVYAQLPNRISMYKTSLNQLIPTGDTSISSDAGDPNYSKTPAGVKFQQQSLSIDDEDFKDNLYMTYEAVAKSMINTHFANMEGRDLMKLSDEEREILQKAGLEFPENEDGEISNEVEIIWDTVRATFNFEVDPEVDKTADDAQKLEGLMRVAELRASDPTLEQQLAMAGKKLNTGELFGEIISLTTDNDKIITDISPEEMADQQAQMEAEQMMAMQKPGQAPQGENPEFIAAGQDGELVPVQQDAVPVEGQGPGDEEIAANVQAVMQEYGIDEETALIALAAESSGMSPEAISDYIMSLKEQEEALV